MEASAGAFQWMERRLDDFDRRIGANHDSIGALRASSGSHETKIEVVTVELRETREDIAEMRSASEKWREEQKAEMAWVRRGLWAAAGSFLVFIIALGTLIAQVAGG
jgi:hypothetical protein